MKTNFEASRSVILNKEVYHKPWGKPSTEAYEGEWIFTRFKKIEILGDKEYDLGQSYGEMTAEDVVDINKALMVFLV